MCLNTDSITSVLHEKIFAGERINTQDALQLFEWDLIELGRAADHRRRLAQDSREVGFIIDRVINFTNVCEAACDFCAFHARADTVPAYELNLDEVLEKIEALVAVSGTQVMLQGGLHPDYTLEYYANMIRSVKRRFPAIYLHSFSPAEIVYMARKSGETIPNVVKNLKSAGLDSIPGASDILVDRIRRQVSPRKMTVDQWREVIRALGDNDMGSSATMTYGLGETLQERIEHFEVIRTIQDEVNNLRAFIPWSFSPAKTRLATVLPATGIDYLRMVAIARIFLDNIKFIQAGWLTEGLKLAQVALAMGANDMGGVLMEEVVVKATGIQTRTHEGELVELIRNACKIPVQRDSLYHVIKRYE